MLNDVTNLLDKYASHVDKEEVILPPASYDLDVKIPENKVPNIDEFEPESLRGRFKIYDESKQKETVAPRKVKDMGTMETHLADPIEEELETMDTILANEVSPNSLLKMCEIYYSLATK